VESHTSISSKKRDSAPYVQRTYTVGQVLYEYSLDLIEYMDDKAQPAALDRWNVVKVAKHSAKYSEAPTVHLQLDGKPYIKVSFSVGTKGPGIGEARFSVTEHAAYVDGVQRIKKALARLRRMQTLAEKKVTATGREAVKASKAAVVAARGVRVPRPKAAKPTKAPTKAKREDDHGR